MIKNKQTNKSEKENQEKENPVSTPEKIIIKMETLQKILNFINFSLEYSDIPVKMKIEIQNVLTQQDTFIKHEEKLES